MLREADVTPNPFLPPALFPKVQLIQTPCTTAWFTPAAPLGIRARTLDERGCEGLQGQQS